jgi:hypothetical protein
MIQWRENIAIVAGQTGNIRHFMKAKIKTTFSVTLYYG